MLVIFDADGTLISGESADWGSFDQAILSVLGIAPDQAFWDSMDEVTAPAIAQAAILFAKRERGAGLEDRIREEYFNRLRAAHLADSRAFQARPGAIALLDRLSGIPGVGVAIATGDWLPTISFKLSVAGIDFSRIPIATASDCRRRSDIVALAAQRAGRAVTDAIYVGDGTWDLRACRTLGIPFIGTGTRTDLLHQAGAKHLHPEFDPGSFLEMARAAAGKN